MHFGIGRTNETVLTVIRLGAKETFLHPPRGYFCYHSKSKRMNEDMLKFLTSSGLRKRTSNTGKVFVSLIPRCKR